MIETFHSNDALAEATANALSERLERGGLFVATGGSTPGPAYEALSRRKLPWGEITVGLTDERWVDPSSDESNERLVRARLPAVKAFLPLRRKGVSMAADAEAAEAALAPMLPAAVTLMGLGSDGHVASLFPGAAELDETERLVVPVAMSGLAPFVPRITLTYRALMRTGMFVFLVKGAEKRALIERIGSDPDYAPPAAAILRQKKVPIRVMWAA